MPLIGADDLHAVLACLAGPDGVAILPTDTICGLHARLDRPGALARIVDLKGRPEGKPMLVLAADADGAADLVAGLPDDVADYLRRLWPGPFTAVLPAAAGLPPEVVSAEGGVAIRVPDREPLRRLLRACGPLASTSANRAGEDPATDLAAASAVFPMLPAWSIDLGAAGQASAVVDLRGGPPVLLRPGPLALPDWGSGA